MKINEDIPRGFQREHHGAAAQMSPHLIHETVGRFSTRILLVTRKYVTVCRIDECDADGPCSQVTRGEGRKRRTIAREISKEQS